MKKYQKNELVVDWSYLKLIFYVYLIRDRLNYHEFKQHIYINNNDLMMK